MAKYNDLFGNNKAVKTKEKAVTLEHESIEPKAKKLPTVFRDSSGVAVPMTIAAINTLGSEAGKGAGDLSNQILDKVKVADTGELGNGIGQILSLTRRVEINKLGETRSGLLGKVMNIFGDTKQKVMNEFETVSDQIVKISGTLVTGIDRMHGETQWLQNAYDANIQYMNELQDVHETVRAMFEEKDQELKEMIAANTASTEEIEDAKMLVNALDKQADKLDRLVYITKLRAPQIRAMQVVNYNTIEKFESLNAIVIPVWKNNMSLALISLQQKRDNELSNNIDNETNRLLKENAKAVGQNMKDSMAANQRGIVDISTLQSIQNDMISAIQETAQIEKKGREERKQATLAIAKMDQDLQNALRNL